MVGAIPVSGNIEAKSFPFLVLDLHQHGATGSLKVDGPAYQKALYFRAGRILFGSSNDPRDQLGAILIDGGKLTPEQLEEVNSKVGPGNPLAKVLADSGLVTQQELSEAAKAKVERILGDLLSYSEGSFEFEDGVLPKGAVDLKLQTEKLVLGAVRQIADRAFVLGHLGSLEVVLTPTGILGTRAADLRTDTSGLVDQFDGRRSLKEAIGQTRLEEFEGAKIACALMFLGLIERSQPKSAPATAAPEKAEESPFAAPGQDQADDEFDLGATARMALGARGGAAHAPSLAFEDDEPESSPAPAAATTILPVPPQPFVAAPQAQAAPSLSIRSEPEPSAPAFVLPHDAPAFVPSPEPPHSAPALPVQVPDVPVIPPFMPATTVMPAPTRVIARQPTTLLGRMDEPMDPSRPEIHPPSSSDLRALDAILGQKPERPAAPAPRRAPMPTFTPQPHPRPTNVGLSRALIFLGLLLVLGGVGGGAWWFALGSKGGRVASTPRPATPLPPPTLAPTATPEALATPEGPDAPPPSPTAAPTVAPTPQPEPPPTAGGSGPATTLLKAGRIPEAAQAALAAARARRTGFTVQILVACSEETIHKALANSPGEALLIVPVTLKGRPCYRLCWGLYGSADEAALADRRLPPYFRQGGAAPRVVPVATIIP